MPGAPCLADFARRGIHTVSPRAPTDLRIRALLSEHYAVQIARDWDTKDERSGFVGYVLRFNVKRSFLNNYEIHTAGNSERREYRTPVADFERFDENIGGNIGVIRSFGRE